MASLEELIVDLTKALNRNAAAMEKAGGGAPKADAGKTASGTTAGAEKGKPGRPPKDSKPSKSAEQIKAVAQKLKDALIKKLDDADEGRAQTIALIKKHGGANLSSLPPASYDAFYKEAEAKIAEAEDDGDGDGDGDDDI